MPTPGIPERFREEPVSRRFQTTDHVTIKSDHPPPGTPGEIIVRGPRWTANIPIALVAAGVTWVASLFVPRQNTDYTQINDELRTIRMQREREAEDNRREFQIVHDELRDVRTKLSVYEATKK
jgi:hypothetical protein